MDVRNLGRSGLRVSLVGLGCNNLGGRIDFDWIGVVDGVVDRAELRIDRVNRRVNGRGLTGAGDHQCVSPGATKVLDHRVQRRIQRLTARERKRHLRDALRRHRHPMIGHRTGQRETILHRVETVHRLLRFGHATARTERANSSKIAFAAIEEIAVEREHDVGALEARNEPRIVTEAQLRCEALRFGQERIVNAPTHLRIHALELGVQTFTRRRMGFFDEEREPGTIADLPARLRDLAAGASAEDMVLVIRPEPGVPYGDVIRAHDAAAAAGIAKVGLMDAPP